MASLSDIHGALAGRLSTIDGLRVAATPPQGLLPPVAYVRLDSYAPQTFSRLSPISFVLELVVLTAQTVRPQDGYGPLMDYADPLGAKSVRLAVWDGNAAGTFTGTLDGTTYACARTDAWVTEFRVLGASEMDAFQMYGGVFAVTVTTSN